MSKMQNPINLQDDLIAFPTAVSGTSRHMSDDPDLHASLDLITCTKHRVPKELDTAVSSYGTFGVFFDENMLPRFDEQSVFKSLQPSDDNFPQKLLEKSQEVGSDAVMSALDQKRGCLNGPRRGRKSRDKFSLEEKVVISGWKRVKETINVVRNVTGEHASFQDPNMVEAPGEDRNANYFSHIEKFLHLQEDLGGFDQRENKNQTSEQIETRPLFNEHERFLMEGLDGIFSVQRAENANKQVEESQPFDNLKTTDLLDKEQIMESVAGHEIYETWLNETQRASYYSSGYESLFAGDSCRDQNQMNSHLKFTSQTNKMELLDLQLQENQRHIKLLEASKNSSFVDVEVCERQPYIDAGMLANVEDSLNNNNTSQNELGIQISSSTCTADVASRGPGQVFFPLRHSIDFHNIGIYFMAEDPYADSVDERSLDLQHQRLQKQWPKGGPRRQWSPEEDRKLKELVQKYGQQRWSHIATSLQGRKGKQCRERWLNHLRSNIKRDEWTEKEEELLISLHDKYENRWAEIAKHIPGRPENAIKNHWNATKRRRDLRNIKPKKATNGTSDSLEMVQRSTVLRNYLQKHLMEDNMTSSCKKYRKSGNTSSFNPMAPDVESPQETVDSSATVSYHNENLQLDLSSTQEGNSFNVDAILQENYKTTRYQDTASKQLSEQSSGFEISLGQGSRLLQLASQAHLGPTSDISPFPNHEISLLDHGCQNVLAFQITPEAERTFWGCGISNFDSTKGDNRDRWGQKLSNFVHSLKSYGQTFQNRPVSQNACCPPALVSCEEDMAVAFKGHTLSANYILQKDTHGRFIKDWFSTSPLSEIVKSCGADFSLMANTVDHRASVTNTSIIEPAVMTRHSQSNEKLQRFLVSDHGQMNLSARKTDELKSLVTLMPDPIQDELVHDSLSADGIVVHPSENIYVLPDGQDFQIIRQVSDACDSKLHNVVPESTMLPAHHWTVQKESIKSLSEKQFFHERIDIHQEELDLIELVTLS